MTEDQDLASAAPSALVRVGSGALMIAGLLTGAVAIQTLVSLVGSGIYAILPPVLLALGLTGVVVGWIMGRARVWAAVLGIALSVILTLATIAWTLLSMSSGVFSLMAVLAVVGSSVSLPLTAISLPACRRASQARERLRAEGLDLGI